MSDDAELGSHVAVVTGGGVGIGQAIAFLLARRGAKVIVADINFSSASQTADEIHAAGGAARAVGTDVTDSASVQQLVTFCEQVFGFPSLLVNNAGGVPVDPRGQNLLLDDAASPGEGTLLTEDIPVSEWDQMIALNLRSVFLVTRAFLPGMRERGHGRIINISSTAARSVGSAAGSHYTAAKAGIIGFSKHVASEMAPFGITVNVVCPGPVLTEKIASAIGPERIEARRKGIPIGRWLQPIDIAEGVAFLLSDRAINITGAVLDVDGGILLGRSDIEFVNAMRQQAWGQRVPRRDQQPAVRS